MRPNRVNPLTDASGPSSPVSQGSREARGRLTGACALARWNWGGAGGGTGAGVPAEGLLRDVREAWIDPERGGWLRLTQKIEVLSNEFQSAFR